MEKKMIKAFSEKKEHAELMRNIFGITAVLYIGFIIWIACIHRYEILWWAFNVWLLLVTLAVKNQSDKVDAELALSYIDYVDSRDELLEFICKQRPWISVTERMPDDGEPVNVAVKWTNGEIHYSLDTYREDFGWEGYDEDMVLAWMPIPKHEQDPTQDPTEQTINETF